MWEYKLVMQEKCMYPTTLESLLAEHGRDGWELCGIDYGHFIFKRKMSAGGPKNRRHRRTRPKRPTPPPSSPAPAED